MADSVQQQQDSTEYVLLEKKAAVTGRLQKRDDERVTYLQKRKEEKEETDAANESVDYFGRQFSASKKDLEVSLAKSDSVDKNGLIDHFDSLAVSLQNIQKFVNDSALFLAAYEVQRAQEMVTTLQNSIQEKRDELLPKKRFAFKSKKKITDKIVSKALEIEKPKFSMQVDITSCSFVDVTGQSLEKHAKELNSQDVAMARLNDCTVKLYGSPNAVHIDNLTRCKIFCGPVSGSIFIDNCINCTFVMACQQMRIHHTTNTHFYIHVTSKAIIEDCSDVLFASYNWDYKELNGHYTLSGLDRNRNNWNDVDDFNWLAKDKHSPNWNILPEEERCHTWPK